MRQNLRTGFADLSQLARARLGLRGATLGAQLAKGQRSFPRAIRPHAQRLSEAEPMLAHPHLARQVNGDELAISIKEMRRYLKGCSAADRWLGLVLNRSGVIVFNLAVLGVALLIWLALR